MIFAGKILVPALCFLFCVDRDHLRNFFSRRVVIEDLLWLLLRFNHRLNLIDNILIDVFKGTSFLGTHLGAGLLIALPSF